MSYDATLPTNRDWVRFLIGDTDTTAEAFVDAEITAILNQQTATGEAKKYYAAAMMLDLLISRYAGKGKGISEKSTKHLKLKWGGSGDMFVEMRSTAATLRREGAKLLSLRSGSTLVFRNL